MSVNINANIPSLQTLITGLAPTDVQSLQSAVPMLQALLTGPADGYRAAPGSSPSVAALPLPPPNLKNLSNPSGSGAYKTYGDPALLSASARQNTFNFLQLIGDTGGASLFAAGATDNSSAAGAGPLGVATPFTATPQTYNPYSGGGNPPGYAPGVSPLTPGSTAPSYVAANQSYLSQLDPQQQAYFKLQQQVNAQAEAASLMAAVEKAKHDAIMAIIGKMS